MACKCLKAPRYCLMTALAVLICGCATSQYQRHYFAAADLDSRTPSLKFYRITIKASAINLKTDFQAGYYDADAVRSLFGEVTKDKAGAGTNTDIKPGTFRLEYRDGQWKMADQNTLFTVFHGADAAAMAAQVDAFASSATTGAQLGQLFGAAFLGDLYVNIEEVEASALDLDTRAKLAAAKLAEIATALEQVQTAEGAQAAERKKQIQEKLHDAALLLANVLGPSLDMPTLPATADLTEIKRVVDDMLTKLVSKPL